MDFKMTRYMLSLLLMSFYMDECSSFISDGTSDTTFPLQSLFRGLEYQRISNIKPYEKDRDYSSRLLGRISNLMFTSEKVMERQLQTKRMMAGAKSQSALRSKISHGLGLLNLINMAMHPRVLSQNSACSCVNYTCRCCLHISSKKLKLNDTVCTALSYLPDELGIEVDLTLDNKILFEEKLSIKNPPPVCAFIPYAKELASICIRLYNISVENKHLSVCVKLELELKHVVVEDYNVGCFKLPPFEVKKKN